jgi:hypothetical protein
MIQFSYRIQKEKLSDSNPEPPNTELKKKSSDSEIDNQALSVCFVVGRLTCTVASCY